MGSATGLLEKFINAFSASYIYDGAYMVATHYMSYLSGTLLLFAVMFRLMTTSVESMEGTGKYAAFLKSLFIWGSVLALYFVLTGIVTDFFNAIYAWSRQSGSIGKAMQQLGMIMADLDTKQAAARANMDILETIHDVFNNLPRGLSFIMFFVTCVLVIFVQLFMQIAQAIGFAVALIVGTIAIPMAITQKLSILKGWAVFSMTILAWPILESIVMYLVIGMASQAGMDLTNVQASNAAATGLYLLFAILNLVMAAVIIAAPFVTMALVSNSGNIAGLVTPFAGAALAATGMVSKALLSQSGGNLVKSAAGGLGNLNHSAGNAITKQIMQKITGGASPSKVTDSPTVGGDTGASASPGAGPTKGPIPMASALAAGSAGGGPVSTAPTNPEPTPSKKSPPRRRPSSPAQQARRGAIINKGKQP